MAKAGLSGWKQIADHLGTSVRTAQRYEQDLGLPVHRLPPPASGVLADTGELDAWKTEVMASAERRAAMERAQRDAQIDAEEPPGNDTLARGGSHWARVALLLLALAAAAALALWVRLTPVTSGPPAADPPAAVSAKPGEPTSSPVLDPGPWPTDGHDMQRTNQGHLRGPRAPGAPRLVYQMPGSDEVPWPAIAVTMDGRLMLGACGFVASIDRAGRELWKREIRAYNGLAVRPGGFAAAADGNTYFTAQDCGNDPDIVQSHLRSVSATGAISVLRDIGSSPHAPALAPNRAIYTLDEINYVRAFQRPKEPIWGTTLASFASGGISLDAAGNLYIGTDGGLTHQPSLWSLAPDGDVRWSALRDELGQAVVGSDRLFVASLTGRVYAFTLDGRQLWSAQVGAIGSHKPLALAQSGTLYLHTARDIVALTPDGTVKWRVGPAAPHAAWSGRPLLDRDEVLYATVRDAVVSLTPDGRERWRVRVPKPLRAIVGDEGVLFVMTSDRKVYEIRD